MSNRKGFSLIELIVTLLVASILVTVAMPNLTKTYDFYRADSNISKIKSFLMTARTQAISYGVRITVCPLEGSSCSSDWSKGMSMFVDSGSSNVLDGDDQVLQVIHAFDASDTLVYSRNAVRFLPTGLASGTNGTFKYCPSSTDSQESVGLVVNNDGRVRDSTSSITCQ
ncbi:GspH/FimT family pseudopilin [Shewanella corallii]|uniref:Type II secretion system protein H n=1 Tax=Shewanella corallii TaxID=560080 RepID=A0ABT0N4J0_9GAMM|nr:GspH/FimT family pseudopilin [Shewanella corallii]MCL2913349.1 GspH/FimT family pseudopilin [Shewanella corallii]